MAKRIAIAAIVLALGALFHFAMVKDKQSLCASGQMTIEQC